MHIKNCTENFQKSMPAKAKIFYINASVDLESVLIYGVFDRSIGVFWNLRHFKPFSPPLKTYLRGTYKTELFCFLALNESVIIVMDRRN